MNLNSAGYEILAPQVQVFVEEYEVWDNPLPQQLLILSFLLVMKMMF